MWVFSKIAICRTQKTWLYPGDKFVKTLQQFAYRDNNFTNESLHVIGQQLDRIEEKIVEKTVSVEKPISEKSISIKTEKPLIDLPS